MIRWVFVVTVVVMALSLSSNTTIPCDIKATVTSTDISDGLNQNQLDLDDVPLTLGEKNSVALNQFHSPQTSQPLVFSPIAIQPIRAPPVNC